MKRRILALAAVLLALVSTSSAQVTRVSRPTTYIASVSGQACSAAVILSIESAATQGFKLLQWCANTTAATAATGVTVSVQRRTTAASSGGTALTNEGTGATAISRMDPNDQVFPGIARLGGTPGTAGATLDQQAYNTGEVGTGAETVPSYTYCEEYGGLGEKPPTVAAGVTNGLSINVSSAGAGAGAFCAIRAVITTTE